MFRDTAKGASKQIINNIRGRLSHKKFYEVFFFLLCFNGKKIFWIKPGTVRACKADPRDWKDRRLLPLFLYM